MTYDPTQHIEGIRRLIATREKKAKGEILTKISSATRNQAKHVCVCCDLRSGISNAFRLHHR